MSFFSEVYMHLTSTLIFIFALTVFIPKPVLAEMVSFDFDDIQASSKKGAKAPDIELYMENLYGANISVSPNTGSGKFAGGSLLQSPSAALGIAGGYLKVGKGKGSGISFDFGDNPIQSFSVDWLLRRGGKSFTILADGVVINQQTLSKAQKKTGASGHQDAFFFDGPVHKLEFIGLKKKSFAIDNLVINIPLPDENIENQGVELSGQNLESIDQNDSDDPNENNDLPGPYLPIGILDNPPSNESNSARSTAVPEPSSLLMLALGVCGAWAARRFASCEHAQNN
jgi:hypothetical protein